MKSKGECRFLPCTTTTFSPFMAAKLMVCFCTAKRCVLKEEGEGTLGIDRQPYVEIVNKGGCMLQLIALGCQSS